MPTSVALSSHFETFVRNQVESGRYNNASEVVRAGLRLLEGQQKQAELQLEAMKAAIAGAEGGGKLRGAGVRDASVESGTQTLTAQSLRLRIQNEPHR